MLTLLLLMAQADDPGAIMAALRDQAAECRYLNELCDEARALRGVEARAQPGAQGLAHSLVVKAETRAAAAARVLRAKHAKPAPCLKRCGDIVAER